ncbi:MAG TPA: hypothetical protein VMZ69_07815 [Saprospiraceae bacterium]|nr:hypothetical protein [Saprospiraceae bacterium]
MRLFAILNSVIVIGIITAVFPSQILSQSYNTALGLRWGDGIGITARQRVLKKASLEGIFYQHNKTDKTIGGIMLDHHMPVITKRLNLYAGGGLGKIFQQKEESPKTSYDAVMINAGLEFTIARLNLSWDFVPVIPINSEEEGLTTLTAFSLRYVLVKKTKNGLFQNDKKKNKKKNHNRHHKQSKRKRE